MAKPNRSGIESVLMTAFLGQSLFLFTGRWLLTAVATATAVSAATHARAVHPDKEHDESERSTCASELRILVLIETAFGA